VCPSWCLKVRAQGHSYRAALEHHIPHYSLDAPKVRIAPAAMGVGCGVGLWIPLFFSDGFTDTFPHPHWPFWESGMRTVWGWDPI
jgi:hypothetical protein